MKCLVTGATGFIGGAIVRRLLDRGYDVTGTTRGAAGTAPTGCHLVQCELADPNALAAAAKDAEVVIHAAGIADARANEEELGWTHVAGTENALAAAKHARCKRFVFLSCANVTLTRAQRSFWNEDRMPTSPPIGALCQTKLQAEELVRVAGNASFRTIVLRPALVWGPGDRTHLPTWCSEAAHGGIRLVGNGKHLFATTYIDNVAFAAELAATADLENASLFYVADEELTLAKDFFREIAIAVDGEPPKAGLPVGFELARAAMGLCRLSPTDILARGYSSAFDCTNARTKLGFRPVATQQQGFTALADWVREQGGLAEVAKGHYRSRK